MTDRTCFGVRNRHGLIRLNSGNTHIGFVWNIKDVGGNIVLEVDLRDICRRSGRVANLRPILAGS